MTRNELYREIKRIDGFIEVLQDFLQGSVCVCISHVNHRTERFRKENEKQLHLLLNIRKYLLSLKGEKDETLAYIDYRPVKFTC